MLTCSSNDGDLVNTSIVGTWDAISLQLDDSATEEEKNIQTLIALLATQKCYLFTLIFEEGGTAILESSAGDLDLSGFLTGGLDISCPADIARESATYTYQGGILSITDAEGTTTEVSAALSGNRLVVDLGGFDLGEVGPNGVVIFERR